MIGSIFLNDWFERNDEYILKNTDIEIGFANIPNKKYSSFLYNESEAENICTDNSLLISEMKNMIKAIGCTNINFKFDKNIDTAATDGKTVYVGTSNIGNNISDYYETLDRIIGMTIHEICHCLYTDFKYINTNKKRFKSPIVHHIHNIIEDEMIENKLCVKFPGYANFLAKLKYNVFELEETEDNDTSDVAIILRILFYLIRYPKLIVNIDESILNKYERHIINIKKIMKDENCFDTVSSSISITKRSIEAAIKIWNYILDNFNTEEDSNSDSDSNNLGDSNDSSTSNDNELSAEDILNDLLKNNSDDDKSNEDKSNKNKSKNDKTIDVKILEETALNSDIIKKIINILNKISSESELVESDKIIAIHKLLEKETNDETQEFEWDHNTETDLNVNEIRNGLIENKYNYDTYFNEMKEYVSKARRLIVPNNKKVEFNDIRFKRNGSLDVNRLANAMCNEQTVYVQKSVKVTNNNPKYALVIMIDESGSMEHMSINILASKIAILVYEALSIYKEIEIFVYGHGDTVYKYITPTTNNKYVLGQRYAQGGQDEVRSYQLIIEDVKKQTNLPIVVFNITDSCYCSNIGKLKNVVHNYINDPTRKISFNLFVLGHGYYGSESPYNDEIYGKGNWLVYNSNGISKSFDITLDLFARIIKRNFKKKYNSIE